MAEKLIGITPLHEATRGVVNAAMTRLHPHKGSIAPTDVSYELELHTIFRQCAYDPDTKILYRLSNMQVAITPDHEELHQPVVTSIGNLKMGLVIQSIHLDDNDFPLHYGNYYTLPRFDEEVDDWSVAIAGLSERDIPMLNDLTQSLKRSIWMGTGAFILAEAAMKDVRRWRLYGEDAA